MNEIKEHVVELGQTYFSQEILDILLNDLDQLHERIDYYFITTNQKSNLIQLELAILTSWAVINYRLDSKGLDKDVFFKIKAF